MKYGKVLFGALFVVPAILATTSCGDDPPPTTPDGNGDDDPIVTYNNLKVGFDQYNLQLDPNQTTAWYDAGSDETVIFIVGNDVSAQDNGQAEVEIRFPGNTTGDFKQADSDQVLLEVSTGVSPTRVEYGMDNNSNVMISCSDYGEVGDTIWGTFSGLLKSGINSRQVDNGEFAVVRAADR